MQLTILYTWLSLCLTPWFAKLQMRLYIVCHFARLSGNIWRNVANISSIFLNSDWLDISSRYAGLRAGCQKINKREQMESTTGKCTRGNFGVLFQGTSTESSNHEDRLLYGHSQCLMSRTVVHDHHWDDQGIAYDFYRAAWNPDAV